MKKSVYFVEGKIGDVWYIDWGYEHSFFSNFQAAKDYLDCNREELNDIYEDMRVAEYRRQ